MLKEIRCAIYTRTSGETEEAQEFTSLDAQRIICKSYIASRQPKGWVTIDEKYEDDGKSGGSINRKGFRKLWKDIEEGKVDVVIIYKMDRLSRSLLDFAKMSDFFTKHEVEFASVTELFDTSTPMGRLALHIIMSFAQYERELASMRIRDKIAESRKRGIWTGGAIPLGFDVKDRKLVINETEAKLVKHIFESFEKYKSVSYVAKELNEQGYKTKARGSEEGTEFKKATVYGILTNATYAGFIAHKETLYRGEHKAIIDEKLWNKAKSCLGKRKHIEIKREASLLKGLIRCYGCDAAMRPIYAKKGENKEYRYYGCNNHLRGKGCKAKDKTIAAGEIEQVIMEQVTVIMGNNELIEKVVKKGRKISLETLKRINNSWENIFPIEQQNIMKQIIETIWFKENGIKIEINNEGLKSVIDSYKETNTTIEVNEEGVSTFVELKLRKDSGRSMILLPSEENMKERKNDVLLNAIVKAHLWKSQIENGEYANIREVCKANNISCTKYVSRILRLNCLAPPIIEAILKGKQPRHIRLSDFMGPKMSMIWEEQLERFYQ